MLELSRNVYLTTLMKFAVLFASGNINGLGRSGYQGSSLYRRPLLPITLERKQF